MKLDNFSVGRRAINTAFSGQNQYTFYIRAGINEREVEEKQKVITIMVII